MVGGWGEDDSHTTVPNESDERAGCAISAMEKNQYIATVSSIVVTETNGMAKADANDFMLIVILILMLMVTL